jgi:AcrR family transcriptional regulator
MYDEGQVLARSSSQFQLFAHPDGVVVTQTAGFSTRERLLKAAIARFGEQGFASTPLKQIAADIGLKAPAIYHHYTSKEELLAEATRWGVANFQDAVTGLDDPDQEPLVRLEHLVRRHVHYQLENVALARANDLLIDEVTLKGVLSDDIAARLRRQMKDHLDLATELISAQWDQGRPGTPRLAALGIISMCDRVNVWYRPAGPLVIDDVADAYWFMVRSMLAR